MQTRTEIEVDTDGLRGIALRFSKHKSNVKSVPQRRRMRAGTSDRVCRSPPAKTVRAHNELSQYLQDGRRTVDELGAKVPIPVPEFLLRGGRCYEPHSAVMAKYLAHTSTDDLRCLDDHNVDVVSGLQ